MKVSLDQLRCGPQHRLGLSFKEQLQSTEAVKPVVGELVVSLDAWGVRLFGAVKTLLKLSCHRCLKPYFQSLDLEIDERFVYGSEKAEPRERELNRDDFVEPVPADGMLDITDIVYQAVTLATPSYCLCGQDCPGPARAVSSGNQALAEAGGTSEKLVDPRWENLKTLFPNEETG